MPSKLNNFNKSKPAARSRPRRIISRKKKFVPDDDRKIHFGKYKNQPVSVLLDADDDYIRFLLTKTNADFAKYEKEYLKFHGITIESGSSSSSDDEEEEEVEVEIELDEA